ncbi:hypothetical protein TNCV_1831081 [Trichonephila clavipes]|nr:hypothetical protein TNCV_1831081 [Trichonephila clavipes]
MAAEVTSVAVTAGEGIHLSIRADVSDRADIPQTCHIFCLNHLYHIRCRVRTSIWVSAEIRRMEPFFLLSLFILPFVKLSAGTTSVGDSLAFFTTTHVL